YLIDDLSDIGFQKKDIYGALLWLKKLASYEKNMYLPVNTITDKLSTRIYTAEELLIFNLDCRSFMLFLENLEIITLNIREIIIESIMALDIVELQLEDLKWIILIILFNIPGCEIFYRKLENLLFDFKIEVLH
ncbi:DUF494 family protein, partial [Buchnera aphidicola]|nr:DUF494 family protein [Buchnera aphidicola]